MKVSNILWGILFIALGIIIGLNIFDIVDINIFFDGWWTLFIIVPCFIDLFKEESKTGSIIGIIIGIALLLACQGIIDFSVLWKLTLPALLVMIGVLFLFKDSFSKKGNEKGKKNGAVVECCSTFGKQEAECLDKFNGCELTAVFGGITYDLRNAQITKDVVIKTCAIFGAITIYLPKDAKVKIHSVPIFGGVNHERKNNKDAEYTVFIDATNIFGGVDLK